MHTSTTYILDNYHYKQIHWIWHWYTFSRCSTIVDFHIPLHKDKKNQNNSTAWHKPKQHSGAINLQVSK